MINLEEIRLCPERHIGSMESTTEIMLVYDDTPENRKGALSYKKVTIVPALYNVINEIFWNATENKQRDKNLDCIKIDISSENGFISIWNNGKGVPIVQDQDEAFLPSLAFGHFPSRRQTRKKTTGGQYGYGAKLCNVFSSKFIVETYSRSDKKLFKQVWEDNMSKTSGANVTTTGKGSDYTQVTFYPDPTKFKQINLNADMVALLSRRAYDVAASTQGVKVYLNGKKINVKSMKDYAKLVLDGIVDGNGKPLMVAHERVNERWEVAVACSSQGLFRQVSFVNAIATTRGGSHVNYVADNLVRKVQESVKEKSKTGVKVLAKQIKDCLFLFINCVIENPVFDSRAREKLTLSARKFDSKCELSEKFCNQVLKCGLVECVMSRATVKAEKAEKEMGTKCSVKKLKGIPNLEDADDAGTRNSIDCTLILAEGDSAKSLAISGLSVLGREKYGVFPLKGKLINVREATHKQILENAEINNIIKIMGLQYKKAYESVEDLKSLRYGRLMIMTDQEQDGSHIKGLLINFFHYYWPSLLKLPFLEEFITPIAKASRENMKISFYSVPEFEEWQMATANWQCWKVKYYKGLGTNTAKEVKEYFMDMPRHRITFQYQGNEDDHAIELAFSKTMIQQRKDWLRHSMEESKQRREMGLPEPHMYYSNTKNVTYQDFVNKQLILFSNMDNQHSIPSLIDGLKPGQRKVLFTCLKRNDKHEIKVAQLAGSVVEHSAYHHGEESLMSTIINLAQEFVGSNNISLLQPIGQFGTRLHGGQDAASPWYIFTMLSPLARFIVPASDDPILKYLYDDNQRIEPEFYIPVLPMVLVNGAEGIGTGWTTKIPNYNPRDIVANLRKMIAGGEPTALKPWFKNFSGSIDQVEPQRFIISGRVAILNSTTIEITELPVQMWTQTYKESVLETLVQGTEKVPPLITDYKEYHTDTTVRFVVSMTEENLSKAREDLHKAFKLQTSLTTSSMVLFDSKGILRTFQTPEDILRDFFVTRLEGYVKRKDYLIGLLSAEAKRLENQARFILEKTEDIITIENRRRKKLIETLQTRGYDPDPLLTWKKQQASRRDSQADSQDEDEDDDTEKEGVHYNYLMGMLLLNLTRELKDDLCKRRDEKKAELELLRRKSPEKLWEEDLDAFSAKLEEVELAERDAESGAKALKGSKGGRGKAGASKKREAEAKPSVRGERAVPKIKAKKADKGPRRGARKAADHDADCGTTERSPDDSGHPASAKAPQRKRAAAGSVTKPAGSKPAEGQDSCSESNSSDSLIAFGSDDDDQGMPAAGLSQQLHRGPPADPQRKRAEENVEEQDDDADLEPSGGKVAVRKPAAGRRAAKKASGTP